MSDFQNVVSDSFVPSSTGAVRGIAALPGGNASTPTLLSCFASQLGNFGSGNPVGKAQVQRVAGGAWLDVTGATITNNGSVSFLAYGVAVRWSVPTLTSPGTGATAPRVVFHATPVTTPASGSSNGRGLVSSHYFGNDVGSTGEVGTVAGFGRLNPATIKGLGTPFKSIVVLTQVGAGTSFIESTYRDADGSFKVKESPSLAGVSGQVVVESFGESHHVDFTDGTGTTDLWLDVFQVPF